MNKVIVKVVAHETAEKLARGDMGVPDPQGKNSLANQNGQTSLSENEQIIMKVVNRVAHKYTFPNYSIEDIIQEGFIIGLEGLEAWDGIRPLENFLAVHIHNRLYNLRRNRYFRPNNPAQEAKKKLIDTAPIEDMYNLLEASSYSENLEFRELVEYIEEKLPSSFRADYLRFRHEDKLGADRERALMGELKRIVGEYYG